MPAKPKPKASPAGESSYNSTEYLGLAMTTPASKPAKAKTVYTMPTVLDVLQNILSVLGDIRHLLGPMRPDFKEEHWYKVK